MFKQIFSFQNLINALSLASQGKSKRQVVCDFFWKREELLTDLHEELTNGTYKHGSYNTFIVNDSKKRTVKAAPFRDRIVHHALCAYLNPIFDNGFIFDSYACRIDKGTHRAITRLERWKPQFRYALSCDISHYFASIDHAILMQLICKKITDPLVLSLCKQIIDSTEDSPGVGIPIGNLTSQLFANIYLNELDQFVKHTLRQKFYIRYMDDCIILSNSKDELHEVKKLIQEFVSTKLKLTLHPKKTVIYQTKGGVDFLGYRLLNGYRRLRKTTVRRFTTRTKTRMRTNMHINEPDMFYAGINSWLGYAEKAKSFNLRKAMSWIPWNMPEGTTDKT